ncbi:hypothetical protein [Pandoraea terrae]|nr:hypothetical protein [Pandoraea terrae]
MAGALAKRAGAQHPARPAAECRPPFESLSFPLAEVHTRAKSAPGSPPPIHVPSGRLALGIQCLLISELVLASAASPLSGNPPRAAAMRSLHLDFPFKQSRLPAAPPVRPDLAPVGRQRASRDIWPIVALRHYPWLLSTTEPSVSTHSGNAGPSGPRLPKLLYWYLMHLVTTRDAGVTDTPPAVSNVTIRKMAPDIVKTRYSAQDILSALGDAAHPFEKLGDFFRNAWAATGNPPIPARKWASAKGWLKRVDALTAPLPVVTQTRLAGLVAQQMADVSAGKPPSIDAISDVLSQTDLRGFAAAKDIFALVDPADNALPFDLEPESTLSGPPGRWPEPGAGEAQEFADHALPFKPDPEPHASVAPFLGAKGEAAYLKGYDYAIGDGAEPAGTGSPGILTTSQGTLLIRGNAGYYRVRQDAGSGQWFIHTGARARPEIPLVWSEASGKWQAEPPLCLRGGGCGGSKGQRPESEAALVSDSIYADDRVLIAVSDRRVRSAINDAFDSLAEMHLKRTNRPEYRARQDHSILEARHDLAKLHRGIDNSEPLWLQQLEAAEATGRYYIDHPTHEAYCHEHAEILSWHLAENGVPLQNFRIITMASGPHTGHVAVLYTESPVVMDVLTHSTPIDQPPDTPDGITATEFARLVFPYRKQTLILDPWASQKIIRFDTATSREDVALAIADTLIDAGIPEGRPYRVSITRPVTPRQSARSSPDRPSRQVRRAPDVTPSAQYVYTPRPVLRPR